ncbi:phosphonate C-P lyase system protein PhnH [Cucumibacter marinus]|uniref:phosphonate C-P lyase system protein PhnH n=1 Tax=Cucumibacter marinus TaxID=1121252 RepID=UPI00042A1AB0|nr:phosphonate C-P lyase system protein PhnH [Cucumibacter marinus]
MLETAPQPGFTDPAIQSQAAFRAVMDAMARPGRIYKAPELITAPAPMNPVAAMIALTLVDFDTPVWLDHGLAQSEDLNRFLAFHTGAPVTSDKTEAAFAFFANPQKLGDIANFALGTDTYPDRSTTLILQVEALTNASGETLKGPGIETERRLGVAPLQPDFWQMAAANAALYPRGIDIIFCTATELACLPRSTRIKQGS